MAQLKTDIQIILDYASKNDVQILFVQDDDVKTRFPGVTHFYNHGKKLLKILIPNLPLAYEETIFQIIRERHEADGILMKTSRADDLHRYEEFKEKNKYGELEEFFQDKIPAPDLIALKISFFMISEKEKGNEIHKYKKALRERFGERGLIISNLCYAGYFENEFRPLFQKEGKEAFEKYYELAVGRNARAIFVHAGMRYAYLYTAFLSMLNKCRRFGLTSFKLHAFSGVNVDLANEVLADIQDREDGFKIIREDEREHAYLTCDIILV